MKRKIAIILALIISAACVAGCGNNLKPLDTEVFDEEEVIATAKTISEHVSGREFEAANDMMREDLRDVLTVEAFSEAYDKLLTETGAFKDYKSVTTAQTEDKKAKTLYAAVQLVAEYENEDIKYTVYMDADLAVTGFYIG